MIKMKNDQNESLCSRNYEALRLLVSYKLIMDLWFKETPPRISNRICKLFFMIILDIVE